MIERIDDKAGTEIHVTSQVPGGIKESHVCIAGSEYTSRIPLGPPLTRR